MTYCGRAQHEEIEWRLVRENVEAGNELGGDPSDWKEARRLIIAVNRRENSVVPNGNYDTPTVQKSFQQLIVRCDVGRAARAILTIHTHVRFLVRKLFF